MAAHPLAAPRPLAISSSPPPPTVGAHDVDGSAASAALNAAARDGALPELMFGLAVVAALLLACALWVAWGVWRRRQRRHRSFTAWLDETASAKPASAARLPRLRSGHRAKTVPDAPEDAPPLEIGGCVLDLASSSGAATSAVRTRPPPRPRGSVGAARGDGADAAPRSKRVSVLGRVLRRCSLQPAPRRSTLLVTGSERSDGLGGAAAAIGQASAVTAAGGEGCDVTLTAATTAGKGEGGSKRASLLAQEPTRSDGVAPGPPPYRQSIVFGRESAESVCEDGGLGDDDGTSEGLVFAQI